MWYLCKPLHLERRQAVVHKIKELAAKKHLSLAELERKSGIQEGNICRWDNHIPSVDKVYKVAKVLRTSVEKLMEE